MRARQQGVWSLHWKARRAGLGVPGNDCSRAGAALPGWGNVCNSHRTMLNDTENSLPLVVDRPIRLVVQSAHRSGYSLLHACFGSLWDPDWSVASGMLPVGACFCAACRRVHRGRTDKTIPAPGAHILVQGVARAGAPPAAP